MPPPRFRCASTTKIPIYKRNIILRNTDQCPPGGPCQLASFWYPRFMERAPYVFAVDGGGSKTAAALLTLDGTEVARCRAGPANLYREPVAGLGEIERAWRMLCEIAHLSPAMAAPRTVVSAG